MTSCTPRSPFPIAKIDLKLATIFDAAIKVLDKRRKQAETKLDSVHGNPLLLPAEDRPWISNARSVKMAIETLKRCLEDDAKAQLHQNVENLKGEIMRLCPSAELPSEVEALRQALDTFEPKTGLWNLASS
jgi:hypothetical protein